MQQEINLVNQLLDLTGKSFANPHDQTLYKLGYLTGVLARLAHDDFYARTFIEHEIKRHAKKK